MSTIVAVPRDTWDGAGRVPETGGEDGAGSADTHRGRVLGGDELGEVIYLEGVGGYSVIEVSEGPGVPTTVDGGGLVSQDESYGGAGFCQESYATVLFIETIRTNSFNILHEVNHFV